MGTEISTEVKTVVPAELMGMKAYANVFVKSGLFTDVADQAKAIVKIMAGREYKMSPFASMNNFHIIAGHVCMAAHAIAAHIKGWRDPLTGKPRYRYKVRELTERNCIIDFYEYLEGKWEPIGESPFSIEDAKRAGTKNTGAYPRNMLFARAMSNGARWHCADLFGGPVYTPEDFNVIVDDDGRVMAMETGSESAVEASFVPEASPATEATPVTETILRPAPEASHANGSGVDTEAEALTAQLKAMKHFPVKGRLLCIQALVGNRTYHSSSDISADDLRQAIAEMERRNAARAPFDSILASSLSEPPTNEEMIDLLSACGVRVANPWAVTPEQWEAATAVLPMALKRLQEQAANTGISDDPWQDEERERGLDLDDEPDPMEANRQTLSAIAR